MAAVGCRRPAAHGRWVHGLLVFTYIHRVSCVCRPKNLVNAESRILLTQATQKPGVQKPSCPAFQPKKTVPITNTSSSIFIKKTLQPKMIFVRCQRLIARKLAELFGFNRGVRPFYAACCFDELSRGSVSCLFNASFEKQFHNATTRFFTPKSMTMASAGAIQDK